MIKLALLVGINRYESDDFDNLQCCEADAEDMSAMLARHWADKPGTGERNYNCRTLTSKGQQRISAEVLREEIDGLMSRAMGDGDIVFYFSGHGVADEEGGFLVTQDATGENPGYPMKELLAAANHSGNPSVVIILDCCHSGQIGNITDGEGFNQVAIAPNVTVLAASGAAQKSSEDRKHSLFTRHVLDALDGGAADCRGEVSAASVYAYVEQALGPWEQRPVYKSYARKLNPIRSCGAEVPDHVLAGLTTWFPYDAFEYPMDKSYEITCNAEAVEAHVEIFNQFKLLRDARLLSGKNGKDLYWVAMENETVHLTPQGRLFWRRAKRGDF